MADRVRAAFAVQMSPTSSPAQMQEAAQWLESFQKTAEAWQTADQLLSMPSEPSISSSHIFAAQTMRTKIVYDWADLPAEAHASLRSSLLAHVVRFGQGPQPVLTQLCLAVGVLALRMESWPTVVNDLIASLTTPPETARQKLPCLLEMLTVLPEEAENFKVGVLPRRRDDFRRLLKEAGPHVLSLLNAVATQFSASCAVGRPGEPAGENDAALIRMIRCVTSWVRHVELPSEQLAASPALPFSFAAMASAEYFDAASDMIVEAIHFSQDAERHQQLVSLLLPAVLSLEPHYTTAVAADDVDAARALIRIFAEAGEQYMRLLLSQPQQWAVPLASVVLRAASHAEAEVAEITFNFW